MTTETKIKVLERMRELLSDPERVVLDPMHYFETPDGDEADATARNALGLGCRVCFCGAASVAAFDVVGPGYSADGWHKANADVREAIADKITALGITSALKQGRAVEVVDAVIADLRAEA